MKNISAEVSIFCLWTNWIHLVTCSKIEFRELHCCSRCALDKIFEIYTFDRCSQGWSGQNHFGLVATQKKRIGEQLNHFWNMCPKPFSWAKNKRKVFSDGKSRGPLLASAALKTNIQKTWRTTMSCRLISPNLNRLLNGRFELSEETFTRCFQTAEANVIWKQMKLKKIDKLSWLGGRRGSNQNLVLEEFSVVFPVRHGRLLLTLKLSAEV